MRLLSASLALLALTACNLGEGDGFSGGGDARPPLQGDGGGDDGGGDDGSGGGDDGGTDGPTDSDGDGLSDADEQALGTDPDKADTDGDGWDDKEEQDAGSDPLVCWDVVSGWADCSQQAQDDGVQGQGWREGQVVTNWSGVDQFGETVDFYQFYGQVIVLDMSAGWCGPCNSAAASAESEYQHYKADGVQFVHLMIDDWSYDGAAPGVSFLDEWASMYGLSFPVTSDDSMGGYAEPYYELYMEGYVEGVPTFAIIGRDMKLEEVWSGYSSSYTASAIERYR